MTSNVTPRYTRSRILLTAPQDAPPRPRNLMVRYSRIPIRHTEFGIRNPRIGNREFGKAANHGAV